MAKIREAKARLEAAAHAKGEAEQKRRDEEQAEREAEGRQRRGKEPAPVDFTPEDKSQTNFTDPEAKIMISSNKGFDYSFNAQAVVDAQEQIIVAADGSDDRTVPMLEGEAGLAFDLGPASVTVGYRATALFGALDTDQGLAPYYLRVGNSDDDFITHSAFVRATIPLGGGS